MTPLPTLLTGSAVLAHSRSTAPLLRFPSLLPATICCYAKLLNTGHATDEYLPALCRFVGVCVGSTCTASAHRGAAFGCLHAHRAPTIRPQCGHGHDCSPRTAAR